MRKGKMFRLPNVKRSNGRHKIPISHTELEKWSEDKIIKTAEKPRELLKPGPGKQAKGLSALYKQALAEIEHEEAKKHESQANVH